MDFCLGHFKKLKFILLLLNLLLMSYQIQQSAFASPSKKVKQNECDCELHSVLPFCGSRSHLFESSPIPDKFSKKTYTDLCIKVEDKELYFIKGLLMRESKFFDALLTNLDENIIELKDEKVNDVITILECINHIKNCITSDNVPSVLKLAYKWDIPSIVSKCAKYICFMDPNLETSNLLHQLNLFKERDNILNSYILFATAGKLSGVQDFSKLSKECNVILNEKFYELSNTSQHPKPLTISSPKIGFHFDDGFSFGSKN